MRRLLPLLALLAACAPKVTPTESWMEGQHESALQQQKALAAEDTRERAMHHAKLASMALAQGDTELAEASLRFAVVRMQDFQADGEFQALIGAEDNKEWKGDPYEKVAAFFTLGLLLHQEGDRGNALAMYKSAIIADAGTADERYRSDFVPAYVMQALAYQAERESSNAEQAMTRAVDAIYARTLTEMLADGLNDIDTDELGLDYEAAAMARVILLSGIPAGVTVYARDPVEATRAAVSQATDIARVQYNLPRKDRSPEFKSLNDRNYEEATAAMGALAEAWRASAEAIPASTMSRLHDEGARLEGLLDDAPNVILMVESGRGPRKIREGEYGEVLKIVPSRSPGREPAVSLRGTEEAPDTLVEGADPDGPMALAFPATQETTTRMDPVYLDSYTWQGTTRGSRAVDGFLEGKAVYKDASFISGIVLDSMADAARASGSDELAAAMQIASAVLLISGAVTNPSADIREWGLLPDSLFLVTADLAPGEHELNIGGRSYVLDVPATGQLVAVVPSLSPGGATTITQR